MSDSTTSDSLVAEATALLRALQMGRGQLNERSALTLLALLDLTPGKSWREAQNPTLGIRAVLDFCRKQWKRPYAENTRETFRRQTIHQFEQAGLVARNPDVARPINSPHNVYRVTPELVELAREFGSDGWQQSLETFLASQEAIRARLSHQRTLNRVPITTTTGETLSLSPGGQNLLIKQVIEEFCPRYSPGGKLLYVGDADQKWAFFDADYLSGLGVKVDSHGKMPDLIVHYAQKNWLLLIEAVTSHGPVDAKRHLELRELFAASSAGLVFVTTFLSRAAMARYLRDIAWESEVWVAEAPDHLIHFNGERFLGPYETAKTT